MKNGLLTTQHVTHPRFKAFKDLIGPDIRVTHIVDVTLLYRNQEDPLSILDIAFGGRVGMLTNLICSILTLQFKY